MLLRIRYGVPIIQRAKHDEAVLSPLPGILIFSKSLCYHKISQKKLAMPGTIADNCILIKIRVRVK